MKSWIMNKTLPLHVAAWLLFTLLVRVCNSALAQQPQDNWYLESTWAKTMAVTNGGLSSPYGVAVGFDQRIYVGDEGAGQVSVYLPDGAFSFAITNGFGGGQTFSNPRGMIIDHRGRLYVADYGQSCVFVFNTNGEFLVKIGGTNGSGDGQLSGVVDVGVALGGDVYVLERDNSRVSVFNSNGAFLRKWGEHGSLDGQLRSASSIAVSYDERIYICQSGPSRVDIEGGPLKVFDKEGKFLSSVSLFSTEGAQPWAVLFFQPVSVRIGPGGMVHVFRSCQAVGYPEQDSSGYWAVLNSDLTTHTSLRLPTGWYQDNVLLWPCHAIGPDGSMVLCSRWTKQLWLYRYALREQWSPPRNAPPMPSVIGKQQRPNSPLVDIDYMVTDGDDTNVATAMLVFTNTSVVPFLTNCIRNPTLVEGTSTNLGTRIAANRTHRLTWNAGADWSVNLGQYRVAILARDSRPGLLDIHYLHLPEGNGMPALKISRSPLIQSDFMQVWWWLLATNDSSITLTSNRIYGVAGAYNSKVLCEDEITTPDGRAYLGEKMSLRQATAEEVRWAKQATLPGGASPNQWPPGRSVAGRPGAVNEYGFDTGNWDTNVCFWAVPLN